MVDLDFSKNNGLIPVIAQDYQTGEVLMLAFMNEEAWEKTQETGIAHYYSRTRKTLWKKGGSSGHIQKVKEIFVDCDNDTLLLKVEQIGAACHKGYRSCFYRKLENGRLKIMSKKAFNPKEVYKNE
ncbi:MAG TPA: phosphoribosyl-AMP cyclohydrolase [Candidatus Desulfofervidus auxilii]|uniref:Phosphoribosyl-AMP cyclohydrolase n=1 Tax=Desulfofervidus auxilii TaxID=1621989 RepID=A0A7C1VMP1_DESA2|nr:MAG: Phosphoribosyl-AMP cyclohydrolase [Candidatus Methanoperedenaceae archaeon GB37]HEC67924.1 phosphoribosyl-AMP cyclohydrolase [Candidatus Desulfofervidus auxilii]